MQLLERGILKYFQRSAENKGGEKDIDWLLAQFGKQRSEARQAYQAFVMAGIGAGSASATALGGKNQQPMAYSPKTGLFYVPANEWGMDIWNEPLWVFVKECG